MNEITDERKADTVRAQLEKICASSRFVNSHKLTQFLRLVVEESLAGRGSQIKEYSIGLEVYNRPSGYDPRVDATVRVEASKLRKRLSEYYSDEGQGDPIRITIPKGHYAPVFEYAAPKSTRNRFALPWRLILSTVAVVIFAAGNVVANQFKKAISARRTAADFNVSGVPYQRQLFPRWRYDRVHRQDRSRCRAGLGEESLAGRSPTDHGRRDGCLEAPLVPSN